MASRKRKSTSGAAAAEAEGDAEGDQGYQEGAIVRVKVKNFVTYSDVEFHPGPNLNVVIGPNGTGKSTIVCAICLGLAGPTSLLGRQKKVHEFIRTGNTEATIELELKCSTGNVVVKRRFNKDNKSHWWINGKSSTQEQVLATVKKLNVQIDNLCQFLPQDKVPEFAKMNQAELLVATEKAVGGQEMVDNHNKLIELGKQERELKDRLENQEEHVQKLRDANALLEPEVDRHKEREAQMETIEMLNKKRPWLVYDRIRQQYADSKAQKETAARALEAAQLKNKPVMEKLGVAKAQQKELKGIKEKMLSDVNTGNKKLGLYASKLESTVNELEEAQAELSDYSRKVTARKNKLEKALEIEEELKAEIVDAPNPDDLQPEIDNITRQSREVAAKLHKCQGQSKYIRDEINPLKRAIAALESDIEKAESQKEVRLKLLKEKDHDTWKAVRWLRENQSMFKKTVHEPILMVLDVHDEAVAKYLESSINIADLTSFVAEDVTDQELFTRKLRDEQKFRINIACDPKTKSNTEYKAPFSIDELKPYGFQDYLINLFDAPDAIKRYLCRAAGVHEMPVGTKKTQDMIEDVLTKMPSLRRFYTDVNRCSVNVSKYGAKKRAVRFQRVLPPRWLNKGSVDGDELSSKKAELKAKKAQYAKCEDELQQLKAEEKVMRAEDQEINKAKDKLLSQKKKLSTLQTKLNTHAKKVRSYHKSIEEAKNEYKEAVVQFNALRKKLSSGNQKFLEETKKQATLMKQHVLADLRFVDATDKVLKLEAENRAAAQEVRYLESQLSHLDKFSRELKVKARKALQEAREAISSEVVTEEWDLRFKMYPDTVEQIDEALHAEQAKLDCHASIDPEILKEYQKRKKEIENIENELESAHEVYEEQLTKIKELKKLWLEPLQKLIGEINESYGAFFKKLDCAGQVSLLEHEYDYAQYGVEIRVKFRAEESLEVLTAHHQSGGERSVSTMLYLMSLQALTKVPFRVVDEINQGMDPNNERRVFSLVVHCSSDTDTSQYFLVTPKLLPNLEYNDKMRVLCVFNGQLMEPEGWNVEAFLEHRAKRNRVG